MPRNKYPEQTIEKILDVSEKLFLENGYDQTSLQDIVDHLGMTKGAIYHHFASKEEILNQVMERFYSNLDWFTKIQENHSLTGLEKLQHVFFHELGSEEKIRMEQMSFRREIDAKVLYKDLSENLKEVTPLLVSFIEEGIQDGSIQTKYPKQICETLLILVNLWINPHLFHVTKEEYRMKIEFLADLLQLLGVPILNQKVQENAIYYYEMITKERSV